MNKKYQSLVWLSMVAMLSTSVFSAEGNVVNITVPKAPDTPKVEAVVPTVNLRVEGEEVSEQTLTPEAQTRAEAESNSSRFGIVSGKRYPPGYFEKKEVASRETADVGEVENARVAAYLQGPLISFDEAKKRIESAGFTLLTSYKVDKKGTVTSMVFTDSNLTAAASKEKRGFAASLRLLVDKKNKQISITNPVFMLKAFMQENYDKELALATLKRLRDNFEGLKNSPDVVKFIRLPRYKFMNSMPVYEDMIEVGAGSNAELLEKARKSKKIIYEQQLDNGSVVLGVKLSKRTSKFVKKTGYQNSQLLPYPLLIENGKAKILAPKYYIAVMYPLLSMSEFMTIATVPGAVQKECGKIFR